MLRTKKMYTFYLKNKKSTLDGLPLIKKFKYWKLVKNEYPYDRIATRHDMLIPLRDFSSFQEVNPKERAEFFKLWNQFSKKKTYDMLMVAFPFSQTYPSRLHFHLMKTKT